MSDWSSGYITNIGYTFGYYGELNPLRVRFAFANAGLAFPEIGVACELGYGQGMSINIHAAASTVKWSGTDFNPGQVAFAQQLGFASGADITLSDEAFAEFCVRSDLPEYDYIGLHGIWSWISAENRGGIVDFVRRKLKVGGVLYISYNTQPGWATMVPLRELLAEHVSVMGSLGQGIAAQIDGALSFADQLLATSPAFARVNPLVAERLKKIQSQSRTYLAHEYFNRDWAPMAFSRMAEHLALAKLDYACSAHMLDHVDQINLTAEQQALLNGISDLNFRQTVRDYCVNQPFRRDYWVKGVRRLDSMERLELLREQRVVLVVPRIEVSLTVNASLGEASMQGAIYNPILDALADHQPKTFAEIEQLVASHGISLGQVVQSLLILTGTGAIHLAQDDATIARSKIQTQKINNYFYRQARCCGDLNYLASPVTGAGFAVTRFHQLFLAALSECQPEADKIAEVVWSLLKLQGQRIVKEGKTIEADADNLAYLAAEALDFINTRLPILKALQII